MEGVLCKDRVYVKTPAEFQDVSEEESEASLEDSLVVFLLLELLEQCLFLLLLEYLFFFEGRHFFLVAFFRLG